MTIRRVEQLEGQMKALGAMGADEVAAQQLAERAGFTVEIFRLATRGGKSFDWHARNRERRALVRELKAAGWSIPRIARLFRLPERTVERWLAAAGGTPALPGDVPTASQ